MWEKLTGWARFLWDAAAETKKNTASIDKLADNDEEILEYVKALAVENQMLRKDNENLRLEIQHEREKRADELEKLELKLRLQVPEELRRLPPAP